MYNKTGFEGLLPKLSKKDTITMTTKIISLIDVLVRKNIEDAELKRMMDELLGLITSFNNGDKYCKKAMMKQYNEITSYVEKAYKLVQKGSIQGMYLAIFMGCGVALGVALTGGNSAFLGVGIAIGAGLGVAIGAAEEKKAQDEDRLY